MSEGQRMLFCKTCGRQTMHLVSRPNHILHLILSIITLGAWLLVWAFVAVFRRAPECTVCGNRRGVFGTS